MKTAISVPDATFERATKRASALGISRSQLFTVAVGKYLDELDADSVTEQLNAAIAAQTEPDDSNAVAAEYSRRRLAAEDEDW